MQTIATKPQDPLFEGMQNDILSFNMLFSMSRLALSPSLMVKINEVYCHQDVQYIVSCFLLDGRGQGLKMGNSLRHFFVLC